jgi:hypothetical protein
MAFAAGPVHGSAAAGGATAITVLSPITAADAADTGAIRRRRDTSHLPRTDVAPTPRVADVTIVSGVALGASGAVIGIHP